MGFLLAVVGSALFLLATPRVDGPLRGWRGTFPGLLLAALAVWSTHASGLGLAASVAQVLAILILAIPCFSYWWGTRLRAAKLRGNEARIRGGVR